MGTQTDRQGEAAAWDAGGPSCPLTFEPLARFMGWRPCRLVGHKSYHLLAVSSCSRNKSGHVLLVAMAAWTVIGVSCPVLLYPAPWISPPDMRINLNLPSLSLSLCLALFLLSHYCTISGLTRFDRNVRWAIYKYDIFNAYIERIKSGRDSTNSQSFSPCFAVFALSRTLTCLPQVLKMICKM